MNTGSTGRVPAIFRRDDVPGRRQPWPTPAKEQGACVLETGPGLRMMNVFLAHFMFIQTYSELQSNKF